MASVTAQAALTGGGQSSANALAIFTVPFGIIQDCISPIPNPLCTVSPTRSISGFVFPDTPFVLKVFAGGGAANNAFFEARADPVLEIADELIPGTNIKFRDAFTLSVSPDVTQSLTTGPESEVPEPTRTCSAPPDAACFLSSWRQGTDNSSSGPRQSKSSPFAEPAFKV